MLALADEMSAEEERYLSDLAERMGLPAETVAALFIWVGDYEALLNSKEEIRRESLRAHVVHTVPVRHRDKVEPLMID